MIQLLKQPYPYDSETRNKLRASIISGLVVGLFLWVFRPFNINETPVENHTLFIWGYGLVTTLTVGAMLFGLPLLLPNQFREDRWTVGKNILIFLLIVLAIGIANTYYTHVATGMNLSFTSFLTFQFYTLAVSFVVASSGTMLRYSLNTKHYAVGAETVNRSLHADDAAVSEQFINADAALILKSDSDKEELVVSTEALLYIESADNYSDVCFLENGVAQHRLLRSSLKRIEESLSTQFVLRCHRSYIVNLLNVDLVSGNSQGYKLHLRGSDKPVPVSRRLNEVVTDALKRLKTTGALL